MHVGLRGTFAQRMSIRKASLQRLRSTSPTSSFVVVTTGEHAKFAPYNEDDTKPLRGARKFRQQLYYLFHDENYSKASLFVLMFIIALIILSTIFYILETVPALSETKKQRDF